MYLQVQVVAVPTVLVLLSFSSTKYLVLLPFVLYKIVPVYTVLSGRIARPTLWALRA